MDLDKSLLKQEFRKRIFNYTIRLLKFLIKLPNEPVIREIKSQATRSGTSIGANYFEGEAASSKKDYQNYFNHSLKSGNETKFWLSCLKYTKMIPKNLLTEWQWLFNETKQLADIFASSVLTMKSKK